MKCWTQFLKIAFLKRIFELSHWLAAHWIEVKFCPWTDSVSFPFKQKKYLHIFTWPHASLKKKKTSRFRSEADLCIRTLFHKTTCTSVSEGRARLFQFPSQPGKHLRSPCFPHIRLQLLPLELECEADSLSAGEFTLYPDFVNFKMISRYWFKCFFGSTGRSQHDL